MPDRTHKGENGHILWGEVNGMVGRLVYRRERGQSRRVEQVQLFGMPLLQVELDPEGFWARHRLRQAGQLLSGAGVRLLLVPEGFDRWEQLGRYGLCGVDRVGFLRAQAAPLAVAAIRKRGQLPGRSAVALRGVRADRGTVLTARMLSEQVRQVCVGFPRGGTALGELLYREYGMAVVPDHAGVDAAVRFDANSRKEGGSVLNLFAPEPDTGEVELRLRGPEGEDTHSLQILTALWQAGRLETGDIEFT